MTHKHIPVAEKMKMHTVAISIPTTLYIELKRINVETNIPVKKYAEEFVARGIEQEIAHSTVAKKVKQQKMQDLYALEDGND